MKKIILFRYLLLLYFWGSALWSSAQSSYPQQETDNSPTNSSSLKWGIIPALAWDADVGLKYGAVFNIFDYGDYKLFPKYQKYLYVRLINSTGGTLQAQALLESDKLLPKTKIVAEASHIRDNRLDFYGFNGSNASYVPDLTASNHPDFLSPHFYKKERFLTRLRFDMQRNITGKSFRLLAGYTWYDLKLKTIRDVDDQHTDESNTGSLYEKYIQWGIIEHDEQGGGNAYTFSLGLVYDTRNEFCYCTNGIWAETFVLFDPGLGSGAGFTRHIATFRHHFSLPDDLVTFSYRISSQQKLRGNTPFYLLPWIYDSRLTNDGPSGAFGLRGAFRNRHVGEGYVLSNFEAKLRIMDFGLFNINFSTSLVLFYDNILITQNYPWNLQNVPNAYRDLLFKDKRQQLHHTFGPGIYIVFNQNNVVSVNYGISPNPQSGSGGLYVGSSLLF